MADVRVRNLEDWIVEAIKAHAKRHGRSLEAELREVLRKEAMRPRHTFLKEAKKRLKQLEGKYGIMPDSTPEIRSERDKRG